MVYMPQLLSDTNLFLPNIFYLCRVIISAGGFYAGYLIFFYRNAMRILNICLTASFLLVACVSTAFSAAADNLYAVGPFNGWDAKNPREFSLDKGNFYITIDFSSDRSFKMSTVSGAGSSGNGWDEFDSGALKPTGTVTLGSWLPIELNYKGNITAPESTELTVEVNLDKMEMRFSKPSAPSYSGTLPVIFINTEGGKAITSKETYLQAEYWLDPCGTEGVEAIGSAEAPLAMQIRGRGNYTWTGFNKKPYRIKLGEKAALAGLDKSKHFVLLAHADDTVGFMRNTLGFGASELLDMPWTPAQKPVEVVLNGDYIGLYFLTENVRVDKNRVNVVEQDDLAVTDVDGGWLVEIDNYDTDPHITVYEGSYPIWFTYKSPEELSSEQENYLRTAMQGIQNVIAAKHYATFASLVDVDILAQYYIVQEIMNDYESFHGSCYLNRQRGADTKWLFGPVWDFGSALFRDNDNRYIYDSEYHQVWIGAVCSNFPQFGDVVKKHWFDFLSAGGPEALAAKGRDMAATIAKAATANYRRWPEYGNENETSSAEVALKRLDSKIKWLKEQWGVPAGVCAAQLPALAISTHKGEIHITTPTATTISICTITGFTRTVELHEGENILTGYPKGVYIVAGRKVLL